MPLHPTQLYEAGAELLILGRAARRPSARAGRSPGRTFWLYMLLYAISRFIIEFYRGDERGTVGMFSTSQFISIVLAPLAIAMLVYLSRAKTPEPKRAKKRPEHGRRLSDPSDRQMPMTMLTVPDRQRRRSGLDRFLASMLPELSRSQIQRLIKDGHVLVAGRAAKVEPGGEDRTGDQPSRCPSRSSAAPQPEALPLPILYQDHDLIVVDKPAGMVVHPAAGPRERHAGQRAAPSRATISAASAARSGPASCTGWTAARRA
mgnify:CR=1 FL=1